MAPKPFRSFAGACLVVFVLVAALLPGAAVAQTAPTPPAGTAQTEEKGLCSPWHHCVALGVVGLVGLYTLFALGMLAYQRRGFDTVEHKMGNPQGVPVKRE